MIINGKEYIKVLLPFTDSDMPGCTGETPWAELIEELPNGNIRARLDNDPVATDIHGFKYNDVIEFSKQDGRWKPSIRLH